MRENQNRRQKKASYRGGCILIREERQKTTKKRLGDICAGEGGGGEWRFREEPLMGTECALLKKGKLLLQGSRIAGIKGKRRKRWRNRWGRTLDHKRERGGQ